MGQLALKNPRMPEIERKYKIECEDAGFSGGEIFGKPLWTQEEHGEIWWRGWFVHTNMFCFAGSWVCSFLIPYSDCIGQHARAMDGDGLILSFWCTESWAQIRKQLKTLCSINSSWFHCVNSTIVCSLDEMMLTPEISQLEIVKALRHSMLWPISHDAWYCLILVFLHFFGGNQQPTSKSSSIFHRGW